MVESLEHERVTSRLAAISGIELMQTIGTWVLMKVEDADQFADRLNRRLGEEAASVPQHLTGAMRIPVRDAKSNDRVIAAVEALVAGLDEEEDEDEEPAI